MELKPIRYKKAYETLIADKIINWMWDNIFQECFEILKGKTVYNAADVIRNALESGLIYYQDGAFYSYSGRFRNELAKELEKLGAKYSKYRKAYLIDKSKIPLELLGAIETIKANTAIKINALQAFLGLKLGELSKSLQTLVFDTAVEQIMQDLQERVYKNAQERKIELITPKLTDFRANEIAKNYTHNLDFWIKNWTEDRIIKMREVVGVMAIDGKSTKTIAEYIKKEFGVSERHAKFLARNESAIATTSYLQAKYISEGLMSFKWHTILDGRERPLHHELNGKIFRFDNPPIIDDVTGQRGLPAETFNCRCTFSPIIDKEFWENRKKLYEKQKGYMQKFKDMIAGKYNTPFKRYESAD